MTGDPAMATCHVNRFRLAKQRLPTKFAARKSFSDSCQTKIVQKPSWSPHAGIIVCDQANPADPLHHTYFYSPKTLKNILVSAGFTVEYMSTINKSNYKIHKSFIKKITYFFLDYLFSFFNKGPVIVCVARKN